MPRSYLVNGPSMITLKGGAHSTVIGNVTQLGLTSDQITITPILRHRDMRVDDFGPDVPANIMANIAEVRIRMTLVHFDYNVLVVAIGESMGGLGNVPLPGILAPAGITLSRGKPLYASGNHLMGMSISSLVAPVPDPGLPIPWTFPAAYLPSPPLDLPLGTERSLVTLEWRAFPYVTPQTNVTPYLSGITNAVEIQSSGAVLWTNTPLT